MRCAGFWTQAWATGVDPVQNLADHLSNPWGNNSKLCNHAISSPLCLPLQPYAPWQLQTMLAHGFENVTSWKMILAASA